MATTNFERFKELLEKKNKKPEKTSEYNWFKTESGKKYTLRFLPLKSENLELPISIYHHHSLTFPDGHFESIACPWKYDSSNSCPFCKLASDSYRKFTQTDDIKYKDAFKQLVVKTHYLLLGFEKPLDVTDITSDNIKIVRASSKASMELIESRLAKGHDFVDFQEGRDVEIMKTTSSGKNAITSITWSFEDSSPAIEGKKGKETFDKLVELSPDLTNLLTPLSKEDLARKFAEFTSAPAEEEEAPSPKIEVSFGNATKKAASGLKPAEKTADSGDIDLESLRAAMED